MSQLEFAFLMSVSVNLTVVVLSIRDKIRSSVVIERLEVKNYKQRIQTSNYLHRWETLINHNTALLKERTELKKKLALMQPYR